MEDRTSVQARWHRLECTITSDADHTEVNSIFQHLHSERVKPKLSPALLDTIVCCFHVVRVHVMSVHGQILGYYSVKNIGLRVSSALKAEGFLMVLDSVPDPVS